MWPKHRNNADRRSGSPNSPGETGMVLLLVMWIVGLLSLVVMGWTHEWRTELKLTANYRDSRQSHRLAEAGVYYAVGKILEAAMSQQTAALRQTLPQQEPSILWQADGRAYQLELTTGDIEIRAADEAGKVNLNVAKEDLLINLFQVLGLERGAAQERAAAIQAWRGRSLQSAPFTLRTEPLPGLAALYPAKQGRFDTVEELAWVQGFGGSPLIPRLGQWLTVQEVGQGVNLNTASREVLLAMGFTASQVDEVLAARLSGPVRQMAQLPRLGQTGRGQFSQPVSFQNSPFYTILSTGIIKKSRARHTIKAIMRLDQGRAKHWEILYWADDYPG